MPTYEYACEACGHEWEQVQRITEEPIKVCPACAQAAAHRLISAGTNFILKGSGWYSDLYASPKAAGDKAEKKDEKTDANVTTSLEKTDKPAAAKPATAESPAPKPSSTSSPQTT
jgi:putative FmdB family regulatory protein